MWFTNLRRMGKSNLLQYRWKWMVYVCLILNVLNGGWCVLLENGIYWRLQSVFWLSIDILLKSNVFLDWKFTCVFFTLNAIRFSEVDWAHNPLNYGLIQLSMYRKAASIFEYYNFVPKTIVFLFRKSYNCRLNIHLMVYLFLGASIDCRLLAFIDER